MLGFKYAQEKEMQIRFDIVPHLDVHFGWKSCRILFGKTLSGLFSFGQLLL